MPLIEITPPDYDVILDIRYATENNFTGRPLYRQAKAFLAPDAAAALQEAIRLAAEQTLKIKIFDAFRPLEIQQALWEHTPDERFISHPETGAVPHCRGVAIDLTLMRQVGSADSTSAPALSMPSAEASKPEQGQSNYVELDMGTGFDDFTERSHHGNTDISPEAQANRHLLMGIMTTAGWDFYRNEWWHYQLFNPREYTKLTDGDAGTSML